jgi:molecular chaperone GrpE
MRVWVIDALDPAHWGSVDTDPPLPRTALAESLTLTRSPPLSSTIPLPPQALASASPSFSPNYAYPYSSGWWPLRGWSSETKTEESASASSSAEGDAAKKGDEGASTSGGDSASLPSQEELLQLLKDKDALLEDATKKVDEAKDRMLRVLADMENLRERTARQSDQARQFAIQSFVKSLLEVADNMERAVAAVPKEVLAGDVSGLDKDKLAAVLKNVIVGVQMTESVLLKSFAQNGVEKYTPMGQRFDPNLHQALFEVPMPDKEDRTIAHVVKAGYTLNGRVIRPADVGVVTGGTPPPPPPEASSSGEGQQQQGKAEGGAEEKK